MSKIIRLTENDLHNIIKESVIKVIKESQYSDEPFVLNGDYTDSEKKKIEKKRKDSERNRKRAETREKNKKQQQKQKDEEEMEKCRYVDLFGKRYSKK